MLYRPAFGKGKMVWGARVDTKIVQSKQEQRTARRQFWLAKPMVAVRISKAIHAIITFWRAYSKELVAAFLALLVGIILFHYQNNLEKKEPRSSLPVSTHVVQT
jgi:hypothetical protein